MSMLSLQIAVGEVGPGGPVSPAAPSAPVAAPSAAVGVAVPGGTRMASGPGDSLTSRDRGVTPVRGMDAPVKVTVFVEDLEPGDVIVTSSGPMPVPVLEVGVAVSPGMVRIVVGDRATLVLPASRLVEVLRP